MTSLTGPTRRTVLRGLSLAALAVAGAPLLGACGREGSDGGSGAADHIALVSSDVGRAVAPSTAVPGAVAGVHGLGAGLYGALAAQAGNVALSPLSVAVALGLTVNGAAGTTRDEMLAVLGAADVATLDEGLDALTTYVESLGGTAPDDSSGADGRTGRSADPLVLQRADALFGQAGVTWEQPFLDALARHFGAGMLTVDWEGDTEGARAAVNTWTAEHTRDKITEILPAGAVSPDTRLVLADALYLKAPWALPFDREGTVSATFHLDDGSSPTVPTMLQTLFTPYAAREGHVAVRLPYADGRVAMTLLVPDVGGLLALEQAVAGGGLPALLDGLADELVDLSLPRWTFRTQCSLAAPLGALGMSTAFTDAADFSAMTTDGPLAIAGVLHQVFIAVDEAGTEAAAATAVDMRATSAPVPGVEVTVDRPFLFVVHDVEHGTPLFVGRVADPRG